MPESTWLWRRVFVFVVTAFVCWQVHRAVDRMADIAITSPVIGVPAFVDLLHWLLALVILMVTYYLVAPSAEQITRMILVAGSLRSGVSFSSTAKATGPTGTAETTASAGKAPDVLDLTREQVVEDAVPIPHRSLWPC